MDENTNLNPDPDQGELLVLGITPGLPDLRLIRKFVGKRVSQAFWRLNNGTREERHEAYTFREPILVNGQPESRISQRVLRAGDVLTIDP